jgi:hypothetical protein
MSLSRVASCRCEAVPAFLEQSDGFGVIVAGGVLAEVGVPRLLWAIGSDEEQVDVTLRGHLAATGPAEECESGAAVIDERGSFFTRTS